MLKLTAYNFSPKQGLLKDSGNGKSIIECYWERGFYPSSRLCKESQCFKKHWAKGYCHDHYTRELYLKRGNYYLTKKEYQDKLKAQRKSDRESNPVWIARRDLALKRRLERHAKRGRFHSRDEIERRWSTAISDCMRYRKFQWHISIDEFRELCKLECYYCDGYFGKTKFGKGLDRIDNNGNYTKDNVLPCCYTCNRTRSNIFTVEETKIMIQAVIEFKKKRSNGR